MADAAAPSLVYACLTHGPQWVDYPAFVSTIRLGAAQQDDGGLNLRDLAPEWVPHHPILGGTAGTFALKNHVVAHHPQATHVGLCQYRKFVSNRRLSRVVAPSYEAMDLVPAVSLSPASLCDTMQPGPRDFMVTRPFTLTDAEANQYDLLEQYGRVHRVEDLLRFTAEAVEQQVLDKTEAEIFFREDWLVTGGVELGVYPAPFWIDAVTAIENITRACVQRYPIAREGYNARAWAFCSERLGSYLLLRHLRDIDKGVVPRRVVDGAARASIGAGTGHARPRRVANRDASVWRRASDKGAALWRRVVRQGAGIAPQRHTGHLNLVLEGEGRDYEIGR